MKQQMGQFLAHRLEMHLSPQMVMQMNLLMLPLLDFNQTIESMAADNPVLEVTPPAEPEAATDADRERDAASSKDEWDEEAMRRIGELADDPAQGGGGGFGGGEGPDGEWTDPLQRVAPTVTLRDDLLEQVRLGLSGKYERIGEYIVQDLESRGFETRTPAELAPDIGAYLGEPVSEAEVAGVLARLKETLEPAGICAANVEESIAIQLKRQGKEAWTDLLVQGFQLLSAGRERELHRLCARHNVDPSFVFEQLAKLNFVPTVGTAEEAFDSNSVRPEVVISREFPEREGPERYSVQYNNNALVRLSLNPKIIDMARRRDALPPAERQFLRQKVQQAKWLKQIVEDRRSLLLRTVQAIVDRQWEFLDHGTRALQPLTQREIADHVGRDESTISRLVKGRFADTPQGCLPLSAFFSQAVGDASGTAAREALREIMDTEGDGVAYTDDELAEEMRRRGFEVQRRTVNKYRRMLGDYYALRRSVRRAMNRRREAAG
jgi:RNA polymerase sigma-54 factor